jgi:hypothetical protein
MQNFVGASKLVGNTQNRPAIPKNRTKTLKTEQKESLEARWTFVGVSPELIGEDRTGRLLQKQQQQIQTMTTNQRFNNTKSNRRKFFFFPWPLQLRRPPPSTPATTTEQGNRHKTKRLQRKL